jgi:hypothetical protein
VEPAKTLKGWKLLILSLFLGPFFLTLYFWERRDAFPAARIYAAVSLLLLGLCAYLGVTVAFSPFAVRIGYGMLFLAVFTLAFMYSWVIESKTRTPEPGPKPRYSLSRAIAWMVVMSIVFMGMGNLVQAIYFWLFGEQVAVYFSAGQSILRFWLVIGLLFGFVYGLRAGDDAFNRDLKSVLRGLGAAFWFIFLYSGLILLLIVYPFQRLGPIAYSPQFSDFLFYLLLFAGICLSVTPLLRRADRYGALRSAALMLVGIPLIAVHAVVVSGYSVTIDLAAASILEDRRAVSAAETLYARVIPHVRHDQLLAALHHRQGVLHVLNQDYDAALGDFKKVLADYSEMYEVYHKARLYVQSYENRGPFSSGGRKILSVRHQTFEQAASCFPNSLSVILNFYEDRPVSTRRLSYAIKESFSEGTFIWKAESFLAAHGYRLITTFWQNKETLIALLDAGYPALVYIPGHVITVYGYDARMEMFFTYDTAQLNRWSDQPFQHFQTQWMRSGFRMSVVVNKETEKEFRDRFPELVRYCKKNRIWQKTQISNYYESRGNYWKDYDRYDISKTLGFDRLKINDPVFMDDDFYPYLWNPQRWEKEIVPVLNRPWAIDWQTMERFTYYLIVTGQAERARRRIQQYESHLATAGYGPFPQLLKVKLAVALSAGNQTEAQSLADKLIGIPVIDNPYAFFWGHFVKGRHLMAAGDLKGAAQVLLSALTALRLDEPDSDRGLRSVLEALAEIEASDPSLIDAKNRQLIEIARIYFAAPPPSR